MSQRTRPTITLPRLAAILVLAGTACAHSSGLTPQANLTGTWLLNRQESEQGAAPGPDDVGRTGGDGRGIPVPVPVPGTGGTLPSPGRGAPGRIPVAIGDGRGGSGRGGTSGLPGVPPGDREIPRRGGKAGSRTLGDRAASARAALELINRGAGRLTITYTDSTVKIADAEGETEHHADGRKTRAYVRDAGEVETRVRWKDGSLFVERSLEDDVRIQEVFTRIEGRDRLTVTTVVKGGPREISFRRIYDARKE